MECGDKEDKKRNNNVDEIWDFQAVCRIKVNFKLKTQAHLVKYD